MRMWNKAVLSGLMCSLVLTGCATSTASSASTAAKEENYDVVVVGAGGAGLSAAIEAYDAGAKVIVLEKMEIAGGNTNRASGGMNASETSVEKENGVEDSNDLFYEDTMKGGYEKNDPALVRYLVDHSAEAIDWLKSLGVNLTGLSISGGQSAKRTHTPEDGSAVGGYLVEHLVENLDDRGVEIVYNTKADAFITDADGKVTGVTAETEDGTVTYHAKSVVLATGGFGANEEMFTKYRPELKGYVTTNHAGATGDGIVMAQEIVAGTVGLDVVQLMPSSSPIKGTMTDGIWGDASQQIWIDGEGNRFVNEYAERDVLAKASLALDNGIFYIIYAGKDVNENGELQGATLEDGLFGTTVQSMVDNGHVWYGSTLKELAENSKTSAGGAAPAFSEEALRATIEKYNTYVANQKDDDFGKEVLAGAIDIDAIENNPDAGFVISPRKASIHHTMGGVQINTNAEVLDESGNAIDGLWAAGEVTGGIHAGNRLGGNAVADIFTFGHIAGASAAQ